MQVHWIREILKRGVVTLEWTPGTEQMADGLIHPLEQMLFQAFVTKAGMTQSD